MDSGWLKIFDLSGPTVLACFATCAGVTYGYENEILLLSFMPVAFVVIANIGIFFFGALTLVWLMRWMRGGIRWLHHKITFSRSVVDQLDSLSDNERQFLRYLLSRNQPHYTISMTNAVTATLMNRGLVRRGSGQHSIVEFPHYIPAKVWKVIRKNADRV